MGYFQDDANYSVPITRSKTYMTHFYEGIKSNNTKSQTKNMFTSTYNKMQCSEITETC